MCDKAIANPSAIAAISVLFDLCPSPKQKKSSAPTPERLSGKQLQLLQLFLMLGLFVRLELAGGSSRESGIFSGLDDDLPVGSDLSRM